MKTGILSMQKIRNYGSFLQGFALKKTIENLGAECEFIDIVPGRILPGMERSFSFLFHKAVDRFLHVDFLSRYQAGKRFQRRFDQEFQKELGVNIHTFSHFDRVFIGSDEVFHFAQPGIPWGYSRSLYGKIDSAEKIFSYAGTFGHTTMKEIEHYHLAGEIAGDLRNLSRISVRDKYSAEIIKVLTGITPEIHVDPVLMFDFTSYERKFDCGDYIAVYSYPNRIKTPAEIKAIQRFAKAKKCKLVAVGFYFPWCDETVIPHPFEVLSIIKNARAVVTDTFHGAVMSIKYNRPFAAIIRNSNREKLSFLLEGMALSHRELENPADLTDLMAQSIDYSTTNQIMKQESLRSHKYIAECLQ